LDEVMNQQLYDGLILDFRAIFTHWTKFFKFFSGNEEIETMKYIEKDLTIAANSGIIF